MKNNGNVAVSLEPSVDNYWLDITADQPNNNGRLLSTNDNNSDFILVKGAKIVEITAQPSLSPEEVKSIISSAEAVSTATKTVVAVAQASMIASITAGMQVIVPQLALPVLGKFMQTIDIINRFSVLNVNYGAKLELFFSILLENMSDIQMPESLFHITYKNYFLQTRGKLTYQEYGLSMLQEFPVYVVLY